MYTSLLLKIAFSFTLLTAGLVGLIHTQFYDDTEVRDLLLPPATCPAPCFMGIRPGVTTYDEAVEILEAHSWVERIESYGDALASCNGQAANLLILIPAARSTCGFPTWV
jgi:hypothetical protein